MMLTFQDAQDRILNKAISKQTHKVKLQEALYAVLAEDVTYDVNMPPFHKSAMDGYACARADLDKTLTVMDTIHAGKDVQIKLSSGQCVKIMTGAPLPEGADMVFMQEDSETLNENQVRCTNLSSKTNVCHQGEDFKIGDVVVPVNTCLQPKHMPLLAGAGYAEVLVFKKPEITIMVTGTELVEPDQKPEPYQIRNSNASQIMGQLKSMWLSCQYNGILKDDVTSLKKNIAAALDKSDVLIMSGGVSVGEYDLVPDMIKELGLTIEVDKTAIQPGKPMVFAYGKGKYIFGLSGNPVASFIQFELYVKPFMYALQGCKWKPQVFQLPVQNEFKRRKTDRHMFVPAQITSDSKVEPIKFHGSAHIGALCHADCLMEIPIGEKLLNKGDMVFIRPL